MERFFFLIRTIISTREAENIKFYYWFTVILNYIFRDAADYMDKLYVKPWCRIGPYIVGFYISYILYKTSCNQNVKGRNNFDHVTFI